ncbi:MAG TPA: HAD family phosphatase [Acidimicrobiales bacterium]|nr:HAD family phosphatase [Acidimicrobiales bacterium]
MAGCIVLDFDGTVIDSEEPLFQSWVELWDHYDEELTAAEWQGSIGTDDGRDPWSDLQRRMGRILDPTLQAARRARRDELLESQSPRPGVVAWLNEARALGIAVGIASSSPSEWVNGHLERLGLHEHFSCVVCADGTIPAKPDPMSYRIACDLLGADPCHSVAVEDSPHGVAAATSAGLFTIAVPHGLTEGLDLTAADLYLDTLEGLTASEALRMARHRPVR